MSTAEAPAGPAAPDDGVTPIYPTAERAKAFADAVVAIAMTLLILPLMESVADVGDEGHGVLEWFDQHAGQLQSFVLSFLLIALSWLTNHRVFAGVERTSAGLLWLLIAWMLTIVWLPVPTAMLGSMDADEAQQIVYIGSLVAAYVVQFFLRWYLLRHPALHAIAPVRLRRGMGADVIIVALFGIALVIAITVPWIGYWALLLLVLVSPLHGLAVRLVEHRARRRAR
ncbi:TMEM175 family protein [Agromyces soli]